MTATDELRLLLDERGVEWLEGSPNKTKWHVGGIEFVATNAWPRNDATRTKMVVHAMYPTPEQAVEATLGRRTCRKLPSSGDAVCIVRRHGYEMEFGYLRCSECGCECFEGARYCMNCGAEAVDA